MFRGALILAFVFSLAACGEQKDRAQTPPVPPVVSPKQVEKKCDAECQAVLRARREHDQRPPKW